MADKKFKIEVGKDGKSYLKIIRDEPVIVEQEIIVPKPKGKKK